MYILQAVEEKPENYRKEISRNFPFKGREAVKQKGLHAGGMADYMKVYILYCMQ